MTMLPLLENWLSPALVRAVGYTLLHSLWQGAGLAGLLAAALPLLRRHRAEVRYATAAGALASLLVVVGLTFGFYYAAGPAPAGVGAGEGGRAGAAASSVRPAAEVDAQVPVAAGAARRLATRPAPAAAAWRSASQFKPEPYLPLLVVGWLLGLLLMSGRLLGGVLYTNKLRRDGAQALGTEWQQRLTVLARRARLRRPVALLESARVAGPLVLGHLRPAILLPLGAVAGLSPALLEALLAHELAHIVRRDYLLNLGLAVAEVLFFYHPAVWFMAGCLRAERENCCDDQAAALCGGDRLRVARALAALAELETLTAATPRLALAAAGVGGRGSLLARVQRLVVGRPTAPTLGEGLLAGLLAGLGLLGLGTGVVLAAPASSRTAKVLVISSKQAVGPADTTRKPTVTSPPPPATDSAPPRVEVAADPEPTVAPTPQVHSYSDSQDRPPRRGRASTVVIEKDKKGRVVNLLVDGQPVDTGAQSGKKAKRGKSVRTVEVVQVPGPAERPELQRLESFEQPDMKNFSFNFQLDGVDDQARQAARDGLAEALRDPALTAEQRQQMEQEMQKLRQSLNSQRFEFKRQAQELSKQRVKLDRQFFKLHMDLDGLGSLADTDHIITRVQPHFRAELLATPRAYYRLRVRPGDGDLGADLAERDAARAARRAETEARRAELRARIAADAAELRALDGGSPSRSFRRVPTPPRPSRAPRAQTAPLPPVPPSAQGPTLPAPPTPPAAPNTARLREELRRDGLIKDDKHFSFELNDQGGRADGQALTPAQVAKYRKLLDRPVSKGKNTKSTFNISVDEN